MENAGEVCLEEEVEKLRRSGMSAPEISNRMGVDQGWVESLVFMTTPDEREKGPPENPGGP